MKPLTVALVTPLAVVFLCLLTAPSATGVNGGVKVRVTQAGFDYVLEDAKAKLVDKVKSVKLPPVKQGRLSLDNIRITTFDVTKISLRPRENTGVLWSMTGATVVIQSDLTYNRISKRGFLSNFGNLFTKVVNRVVDDVKDIADGVVKKVDDKFKQLTSGTVTCSASKVSLTLVVIMKAHPTTGRPVLSVHECDCSIGSIDVTISNNPISSIVNNITPLFKNTIKNTAQNKICEQAVKTVKENGNDAMGKLKVKTSVVGPEFDLDYGLVDSPTFTSSYMETHHKGEIYWNNDNKRTSLSPATLPTITDTSRMIYVWVSEYVFNTFIESALHHKYFKDSVTDRKLNPSMLAFLNTTCIDNTCIGKIVNEIGSKYPQLGVSFDAETTKAPIVAIKASGIVANFEGVANFFLVQQPRVMLLRLGANVTATLQATALNEKISVSVSDLEIGVKVLESPIGSILDHHLNRAVQLISDNYLKNALNERLFANGFAIPVTGLMKLVKPKLTLVSGAILVESDVVLN